MDLIYWDHYYDKALIGNLIIVLVLFTAIRWFSGMAERMDPSNELLIKDNPAFGISLAGKIFGVTVMLSGMIFGGNIETVQSLLAVFLTGISGIFFMAVAHFIFTKVVFYKISVRDEIVKRNIAVAVADAGNILAAAIIVRAIMDWMPPQGIKGFFTFVLAFVISQILFTCSTLIKAWLFKTVRKARSSIQEMKEGNIALALVFAGKKIGTGFAIALAANIIATETDETARILFTWFWVSVLIIILFELLCYLSTKLILYKVNISEEIVTQRNSALGALQAIIYISLGYLLSLF
jgi:uncharacterized membrane protein YjfL (UPF0719 family)